jgi:hypothetical protein
MGAWVEPYSITAKARDGLVVIDEHVEFGVRAVEHLLIAWAVETEQRAVTCDA